MNPRARSRPSLSLAFKLALLALGPFVVLSTVLLSGFTYQFQRLSEEIIGKQEMEIAAPVAQGIEAAVRNAQDSLAAAALRFATLPAWDEGSLREALEHEDQLLLWFSEGLLLADTQHQVMASSGPVLKRRARQTTYVFPSASDGHVVSPAFEALSAPGHPAVAQTVPIVAEGKLRGYLSGASDLFGPRFLGPYRKSRFGDLGYFSLTTPDRTLILHKDQARILRCGGPAGVNHAIDRGLGGWEGWMLTTTASGEMITAIRQVPSTGWVLSVHYPKSVASSPFLKARRELLLAVALGAAVLLAFVLALSRRILRPLSAMTRQVEALTKGTSDVLLVPIYSGDEIGVLSNAFNRLVQERGVAEKELRASEERFRLAFRTSPEPMSMTRLPDKVLVAVNEGFEHLFGVTEAGALGHCLEDLGIRIEAPNPEMATSPGGGGFSHREVMQAITAEGRRIDLLVSSSFVNVRGSAHLLTISQDVTALRAAEAERERLALELRTSEERYRRVVRNVPVVQWALDNNGVFTLAEGLGLLSLGHRSEEMVGANLLQVYGDNQQILRYFASAKAGQVVSGPFEHGTAAFDSHWGPLRDEKGAIVGVTAIALDVTESRRAELARRATESQMAVLERLVATGRLAAGVAHEINNPLTYVIWNLEEIQSLLASQTGADALRQCAREAMEGAARVAAIVRDLRVFSGRPQKGQPRCNPAKVGESAVALMRNQIRHRARLELAAQSTPEAGIEEGRLAQVLVNLLMNACQAIAEGHVEENLVRVDIGYASPWIVVQVTDSGEGIAPEVIPHLFEPFFTTRKIGEGSGLGLSVSFAIVTEVGGSIEVRSRKGEGTKIAVKLPVADAAASAIAPASPELAHPKRLRLLVMDDEPLVGRAIARYLREHDVVVENGACKGLDRLRRGEHYDAILTDIMMPEMSGIQFYEHVQRELPGLVQKIVFISGGAFGPEAQAFLASVKPTVFEKPLDMRTLMDYLLRLASDAPPSGA